MHLNDNIILGKKKKKAISQHGILVLLSIKKKLGPWLRIKNLPNYLILKFDPKF